MTNNTEENIILKNKDDKNTSDKVVISRSSNKNKSKKNALNNNNYISSTNKIIIENNKEKEELLILLKEAELILKAEQEITSRKTIELNKNIDLKNRLISTLSDNNNKLSYEIKSCTNQLEEFKFKEEEKSNLVSLNNNLSTSIKNNKLNNSNILSSDPKQIVLKVKEKEIDEAISAFEILKSEVDNLKNAVNQRGDFETVTKLEGSILFEENKQAELSKNIEFTDKLVMDIKKDLEAISLNNNIEKKKRYNEFRILKDKFKDVKTKLDNNNKLLNTKKDLMIKLKRELHIYEDKNGIRLLVNKLSKEKNSNKHNNIPHTNKGNLLNSQNNNNSSINKLNSSIKYNNINYIKNRSLSREKNKNRFITISKGKNNIKDKFLEDFLNSKNSNNLNIKFNLFENIEDKNEFEKFVSSESLSLYEAKFDSINRQKEVSFKKYFTSTKTLNKLIKDYESRFELAIHNTRSQEQKAKILSHEIDDQKKENKRLNLINIELSRKLELIKNDTDEKENEIKNLVETIMNKKEEYEKEINNLINDCNNLILNKDNDKNNLNNSKTNLDISNYNEKSITDNDDSNNQSNN